MARTDRSRRLEARQGWRCLILLAALAPARSAARGQPCTAEMVSGLSGSWTHGADATSGAGDHGFPRKELPALLRDLDRHRELLERALGEPRGFDVKWHKVVGLEPLVRGGPQPFALEAGLFHYRCEGGKVAILSDATGEADIHANGLFQLVRGTGRELGGKEIHQLAYSLGELRGFPLFESPFTASLGERTAVTEWALLVAKPGRLPFRYITRGELLDYMQGELQRERRKAGEVKDPAAAARLAAVYDAKLARVAAVRRSLGAAQLGEPASLRSGAIAPTSVDASWGFVEPKTDRAHRCTVDCRHGMRLVTVDPSYLDRARPRGAPQLMVVSFTWTASARERYLGPFDEALRDAFFQRLDVGALAAMVGR